jgi:uncharacterized protein (DUF952 family)
VAFAADGAGEEIGGGGALALLRWLYHLLPLREPCDAPIAPRSEGFVHASYRDDVSESARLHFPSGSSLEVLQIDPRRLEARVEIASTPRGEMPHIYGLVPTDAIVRRCSLAVFEAGREMLPDGIRDD